MLKRLVLTMMVIGAIAACAQTPPPAPPPDTRADEAKIKADLQKWMDDFNAGNAAGVASQYADDAVLMPPNAPAVTGRAGVQAYFTKEMEGMKAGGLTIKTTATTGLGVSGDWAWMTGNYAITDAKGATIDVGKYLSVHRKIGGAWPYVRDIWNSDNPPPPPPPAKK
jgi:ketosteroid isomerase-like protein